jgi:hypothetical protein
MLEVDMPSGSQNCYDHYIVTLLRLYMVISTVSLSLVVTVCMLCFHCPTHVYNACSYI